MKRKLLVLLVCLSVIAGAFALSGCGGIDVKVEIKEPNLASDASIAYASNNVKNAKNLVDGKDGSKTVFDGKKRGVIDVDFGKEVTFNTVVLKESTDNVKLFRLYAEKDGDWEMIYEQDRIWTYRMCYTETITTSKLRIDIVDAQGAVKIKDMGVYNLEKKDVSNFRVTQYLVMMDKNEAGEMTFQMEDVIDDAGFTGNYDVVTDIMLIGAIRLTKDGTVSFGNFTEEEFAENLANLRLIIAGRNVNIRATVFNNPYGDYNQDKDFLNSKRETINASLKAFVEKYNMDGLDYDWEYPTTGAQWKAYGQLVSDTAQYTSVSVALPTWGIQFSKSVIEKIDFVNLMTYDLFDNRGDHSNIYIGGLDGVSKLIRQGFAPNQICLGLPSYGRTVDGSANAWPEAKNYQDELGKWGNIIQDFEYTDKVDGIEVKKTNTAYVNGYAISRDKTLLAMQMQLGGIMIFRARCDSPYTYEYSMHRAIGDTLSQMGK